MNLFFLMTPETAFYWVRASSLESPGFRVRKQQLFSTQYFERDSIFIFNRFGTDRYFRIFHTLCRIAKAPYVFDFDDLFWELPSFSQDPASLFAPFLERLIKSAVLITTSTEELRRRFLERWPGHTVVVIENCPPQWYAPQPAVLIANTDSFKMGPENIGWFIKLLGEIFERGLSIQLIGSNQNLLAHAIPFPVYALPLIPYAEYLSLLSRERYAMALLPVDNTPYSDCKSAIKAVEFTGYGIPIVASDILPYRIFKQNNSDLDFCVVQNDYSSWKGAIEGILARIPASILETSKGRNNLLKVTHETQCAQWLQATEMLSKYKIPERKILLIGRCMRKYAVIVKYFRRFQRLIKGRW